MKKLPLFLIWFMFLILSACIPDGTKFSPERFITRELIQNHNAVPESIRIYQNQPWQGNKIILVGYTSINQKEKLGCEGVFEIQSSTTGWRMSGGGTGCSSLPNIDSVTYGSGTQGVAPEGFSYAYGLVTQNEAQWVEITWGDGVDQRVPVVNGSYLALREDLIQNIPNIQVLNAAEEVIQSRP